MVKWIPECGVCIWSAGTVRTCGEPSLVLPWVVAPVNGMPASCEWTWPPWDMRLSSQGCSHICPMQLHFLVPLLNEQLPGFSKVRNTGYCPLASWVLSSCLLSGLASKWSTITLWVRIVSINLGRTLPPPVSVCCRKVDVVEILFPIWSANTLFFLHLYECIRTITKPKTTATITKPKQQQQLPNLKQRSFTYLIPAKGQKAINTTQPNFQVLFLVHMYLVWRGFL